MLLQITVGKSYSLVTQCLKVTGVPGSELCRFVEFAFLSQEKTFNLKKQPDC